MKVFLMIACAVPLLGAAGCATIVYPRRAGLPKELRGGIDWTMLATNVMFTGGLGLLVDFWHGTIYQPTEAFRDRGYDRSLFRP